MIVRIAALRIATAGTFLLLAGCASEPVSPSFDSQMSYLGAIPAAQAARASDAASPTRKNIASKVLSAMAFERVTGIKADPARLLEGE